MPGEANESPRALKVFVSSTYIVDAKQLEVVTQAIVTAGMVPVGEEWFTADSRPTVEVRQAQVHECDLLVGIVAHRYGGIPGGEHRSLMEIEYDTAVEQELPRLMFVVDDSVSVNPKTDFDLGADRWDKQKKLEAFKEKFSRDQAPTTFDDRTLGMKITQALQAERQRLKSDGPRSAGELTDRALRRYLDKIEATHREVHMVGFETAVRVPLELDDLYVPLDAFLDHRGRGRDAFGAAQLDDFADGDQKRGYRHEVPLADAFERAGAMGRRGVVLLGDPGSGKTTHLKQVLLQLVRKGPQSLGLPEGTVPVFLPLRNLRDRAGGMSQFIEQQLADPLLRLPPSYGRQLVERGKLLYLFDGLDEVTDAGERELVARWIEQTRQASSDNYFLVSCRYAGYTPDVQLDAGFVELHLRPMNDAQVKQFVQRWYRLVEQAMHSDPERAEDEAIRGAKALLKILDDSELMASARVYEMTRNPLLLTAICLVHRDIGELPKERAKLYEEAVSVLLERWRTVTKKLPVTVPAKQALKVMEPVALWMHQEQGRTQATSDELREVVADGLKALRGVELEPEVLLEAIRDESGLLTGWGVDRFGFMHLGFQEYLAARAIAEQSHQETPTGKVDVLEQLATRFGDSWWQEVILLLVAQGDRRLFERFMAHVVRQDGFAEWAESQTMQLCLSEAGGLSAEPFVELLRERANVPRSESPQGDDRQVGRQMAAARMLARTMPDALVEHGSILGNHLSETLRTWWHKWRAQDEVSRSVVTAPRGGVRLVFIPGGTFMMGSPKGVGFKSEHPRHFVKLDSFYLAKTPVTNAQYGEFLKVHPRAKPLYWGDRRFNQPDLPVVGVSWTDAAAYCDWAGLTLPTEAQWEYACRAGTTTAYYSGESEQDLAQVGWHGLNSGRRLHEVGEPKPNDFGLYDMHGNIWEWCRDASGSYAKHPQPGDGLRHEPVGTADRVVRGGGWCDYAGVTRSACRGAEVASYCYHDVGFRPAKAHP